MSLAMSDNFAGTAGGTFSGDSSYTVHTGTLGLVACTYGVAVRVPAATQNWIEQVAFTGATTRVFSRIYKFSATPTATAEIIEIRTASAKLCYAQLQTGTGKLQIVNASSTILASSTASVPIATEFRVVYTVNGTSFTAAIYPNTTSTTPTQTLSGTIVSGTMTFTRDGCPTTGGLVGCDMDIIWPQDDTASDPGIRVLVTCALSVSSGIVPKAVTATATVINLPAGTAVYTFTWGDGATTGPQAGNSATHTYTVEGVYSATITLDVT